MPQRILQAALALVVAVALGSCKENGAGPGPSLNLGCIFTGANKPQKTAFSALVTNGENTVDFEGEEGSWERGTGLVGLTSQRVQLALRVSEPTFTQDGKCFIALTQLESTDAAGASLRLSSEERPDGNFLELLHLDDESIAATGTVPVDVFPSDFEPGSTPELAWLTIEFDVVTNICSADGRAPESGRYDVGLGTTAGTADVTFGGTITRWDRNIGVISLGEESEGSVAYGLTLRVLEPVRAVGDSCRITLEVAQVTLTDSSQTPIAVKFYQFPTESEESTQQNDYLWVDFINDSIISVEGLIPMQRMDAFGWLEKVWVYVEIDAFEVGSGP